MRDAYEEIRARGAALAAVGSGTEAMARAFQEEQGLPFPLYVDPSRRAYEAAGLKRGAASTFSPRVLKNALRARRRGFRQTAVQGDPWQQGGVLVILPDDTIALHYVSEVAGDHPEVAAVLAALPAAGAAP